jgi:hypothetical protein
MPNSGLIEGVDLRWTEGKCSLVAAGMVLRRNQHKAWAHVNRLKLPGTSKRGEDTEDNHISGEDAEADRGEDCEAENERHNQRNHDQPTLFWVRIFMVRRFPVRPVAFETSHFQQIISSNSLQTATQPSDEVVIPALLLRHPSATLRCTVPKSVYGHFESSSGVTLKSNRVDAPRY